MFDPLIRAMPLAAFHPLRRAAVRLRRGSFARSACVLALKPVAAAFQHRLAQRLAEIRPLDAPNLSFEPTDSMVMEAVYWFGVQGYEGRVADVWSNLCRSARSVLEIGGNVGLFTVIGAQATHGTYTVVEPVPEVAAVLRKNLARNRIFAPRVVVVEAAVIPGDSEKIVSLNVPQERRDAPVGAHLVDDVEVLRRSTAKTLRVTGKPVRTLVAGRDLIKIDAEGIEAELLAACRDLILAEKPSLLVEVLPEAHRLGELLDSLARDAGYVISIIPEYGSDQIVTVAAQQFSVELPQRYNSKDVLLSTAPP
jgi:FkbM family methyltransferase